MKTRQTKTGLDLTEMSFGCGAIGGLYNAVSDEQAAVVLTSAWRHGIRYFDTAPFYGHGRSEERVGAFLKTKPRDEFVLSTKVGKLLVPCDKNQVPNHNFVDPLPYDIVFDYTRDGILKSYESSLERLGLDRIDILYVHDLEPISHTLEEYHDYMTDFLSDGINALYELKESGRISAFGLGVNQVEPCLKILRYVPLDVILLAGRYTLLDRTAEIQLLDLCEKNKTDLVIGGVFNSGILATGAVDGAYFDYELASSEIAQFVNQLENICLQNDVGLAATSLQFPLRCKSVKSVLIGTAKTLSLSRNLKDFDREIPEDVYDLIDQFLTIDA